MKDLISKYSILVAFLLTIPAANWTIHNIGTVCDRICLIPVWPEIMAPSGVVWAGLAFVLRDVVHRQLGAKWAAIGIFSGAALSFGVASPHVAIASAIAFLFSEFVDFAVYVPLAKRGWILAVVASSAVGLVVDSVLFLQVAFGSLDYLDGQIIAKLYAVAIVVPLLMWWNARHQAAA